MTFKSHLVLSSQSGTSGAAAAHQSGRTVGGKFSRKSIVNGAFVFCGDTTTKTSAEGPFDDPFFFLGDLLAFFLTR